MISFSWIYSGLILKRQPLFFYGSACCSQGCLKTTHITNYLEGEEGQFQNTHYTHKLNNYTMKYLSVKYLLWSLLCSVICGERWLYFLLRVKIMVFNANFNNISVISWQSVSLVEETRETGENPRPATSNCQTLSCNVVSSTPRHVRDLNSQL